MDSVAASPREYLVRRAAKNVISPPKKTTQNPPSKRRVDSVAASPREYLVRRVAKNVISPPQNPPKPAAVYKPWSNYFPVALCTTKLARSTSQYHFVLQSLQEALPSTTVYYKTCTKHFPVLLCTTRLAKSFPVLLCTTKLATTTSQYYFVLQSLHKVVRSTTLYYKACTKSFPVLLCITKLAQSTSCTNYFPVLLCTTQRAQRTSLYYCVLRQLAQTTFPVATLYYKACTKHFPVPLCTTKLAHFLHKLLPSTTVYYKTCTKHVPSTTLYYTGLHKSFPGPTVLLQSLQRDYFPVLLCTSKACSICTSAEYYCVLHSIAVKLGSFTQPYHFVLQAACIS